eukprot:6092585-Prymnesium_polylepis.1
MDQLSGWNAPLWSTTGGHGPPVYPPSRRSHLAPCSLPVSSRLEADQVHRSYRRYGTHPTPRTLPAMHTAVTRRPCRRCVRYRASARVISSAVRP